MHGIKLKFLVKKLKFLFFLNVSETQDEVCFFFSMHGIKLKYFKETEISSKQTEILESMI